MNTDIRLVQIGRLKCHERVSSARLSVVRHALLRDGAVRRPIIADRKTGVILDGHHRFTALRSLGATRVPVQFVLYSDPSVRVYLRRRALCMILLKEAVIRAAAGRKFPPKTTRHLISGRIPMSRIPLGLLRPRRMSTDVYWRRA